MPQARLVTPQVYAFYWAVPLPGNMENMTAMIIPICLVLAAWGRRRAKAAGQCRTTWGRRGAKLAETPHPRVRILALVPWFLTGFLIVAAANTIGLIPSGIHAGLRSVSVFLITVALSAIGLSTNLAGFRRAGVRPLLLGAALWVTVTLTSLGLQISTGLA